MVAFIHSHSSIQIRVYVRVQLQDNISTLCRELSPEIISINSKTAIGRMLHDLTECMFVDEISCAFVSIDMRMEGVLNKLC